MDAKSYTTSFEGNVATDVEERLAFFPDCDGQERGLINLYPQMKYQVLSCFGGAITEAVGMTLERMGTENARTVIEAYFGKSGVGYRAIRTHIDSCDFASEGYSAVSDPNDKTLSSFSLQHDERYIIPYIKMAYKAAGTTLPVMLSPWSPPAYMKTNGARNGGGKLKQEYYSLWAIYLCRYIAEYRKRGINVHALSIQNEPNAVQTWDSCLFTGAEEREFLRHHLYPCMLQSGLDDVGVYIWDHNKERLFERACEEIDTRTNHMIAGLAFHWYSGDHFDALRLVREKFPDKKLIFSEGCIEYSRFDGNQLRNAQMYAHDILGNLNAGMNAFLDWNIALDENGGPNHAGNFCEAPVICNTNTQTAEYRLSFRYISHFSRYIRPGAQRIATTNYSDRLEITAFQNADDTIVVVLLNRTKEKFPAALRLEGALLATSIAPESIKTIVIRQ